MLKNFILLILFFNISYSQTDDTLFVGFWNLENLFDTVDDPLTDDEEYLPDSEKGWDSLKLHTKLQNIADVILSMNNNSGPDLLGVCEVENREVLELLAGKYLYGRYFISHIESPDNRGIDNGLLYRKDLFEAVLVSGDTVHLADGYPTRLILSTTLRYEEDTIQVYVNHWPSRRGGEKESELNRISAASVLRNNINSLLLNSVLANILVMGDFNDEPSDTSLSEVLKAYSYLCDPLPPGALGTFAGKQPTPPDQLFNLAYKEYVDGYGTYKYKDDWNMLDQIIVGGNLITGNLRYICNSFEIFKAEIMITKMGKYAGTPRPSFGGKNYLAGYSDHFPVTAKFIRSRE